LGLRNRGHVSLDNHLLGKRARNRANGKQQEQVKRAPKNMGLNRAIRLFFRLTDRFTGIVISRN
jgi:hypothetical protein